MTAQFQPVTAGHADVVASPSLARVARGDLCAGCGGCAALVPGKIEIRAKAPGFLRPVQTVTLTTQEEAAISAICPGLGQRVDAEGRADHSLWGPYRLMQKAWATDPALHHAGASGGALSGLLSQLLATGQVDAVIQTAAAPELAIGNTTVVSLDDGDLARAAGSRYAPSAPLADLDLRVSEHTATGRKFAFVGKPCDAVAMQGIRAADPRVAAAVPVILSFFCAGVPSHAGGTEVLTELGVDTGTVHSFRYRGNGWPGRATAMLKDGSERSMSYHDSWGKILSRHVQHRCKICADGTGMAADIVCADAWECDDTGYPVFDEAPGVSLVVARTALGETLLAEAEKNGKLETAPFDVAELTAMQPGQRERRRALLARLAALRLAGRPIPRYEGLHLAAAARQNPLKRNIRNFLGTLRRTLRPRR